MMIGDLNEIIDEIEKYRGRPVWKRYPFLRHFMHETGCIDLGHMGQHFTWNNGQGGMAMIKERIDRALADHQWISKFPNAIVKNLNT